jgi:hypothetical protein
MASKKPTVVKKGELIVQARCQSFYQKKGTVPFLKGLIGGTRRAATAKRRQSPG